MIRRGARRVATRMQGNRVIGKVCKGSELLYRRAWLNVTASLSFAATGESKTLEIDCPDGFAWTLNGLPAGFTASAGGGTGVGTVIITAGNNTSASIRSETITVTGSGLSASCTLTQSAGGVSYTLTLNPYTTSLPAVGGSTSITGVYRTYWNGSLTQTDNVSPTLTGSQQGFSLSGNTITAINWDKTEWGGATLSGTASYGGASAAYSIIQSANVKMLQSISAGCAASSNIPVSYTNQQDWMAAAGGYFTLFCNAQYKFSTEAWSDESVTGSALFTVTGSYGSIAGNIFTIPGREAIDGNDRYSSVSVTFGGKTTSFNTGQQYNHPKSTSRTASLSANAGTSPAAPLPASRATATVSCSGSAVDTYTSGVDGDPYGFTPTLSIYGTGFSLSGTTVTAESRGREPGNGRWCTVTAYHGGTPLQEIKIYQAPNQIVSYGALSVSLAYDYVPYRGGTVSPQLSYSQPVTYSSNEIDYITSGAYVEYSSQANIMLYVNYSGVATVSENYGYADRTGDVTVKVTLQGKSVTKTCQITQYGQLRPEAIYITTSVSGNTLTFRLTSPSRDNFRIYFIALQGGNYNMCGSTGVGIGATYGEFTVSSGDYTSDIYIYSLEMQQEVPFTGSSGQQYTW